MKNKLFFGLCLLLALWGDFLYARDTVIAINVPGIIGPAISDYIVSNITSANNNSDVKLIILELNTQGGLKEATNRIVKSMLSSRVPVISFVYPSGASVAGLGTYVVSASHLAVMAGKTHLELSTKYYDAFKGRELLTGKNVRWVELFGKGKILLTAEESLKRNIIDFIANDLNDLLNQINGKKVLIGNKEIYIDLHAPIIETRKLSWQNRLLLIITHPNIAIFLLMFGINGIFFEFYHPGLIFPGTLGSICLLIALYGLNVLPVNLIGLILLIIGNMLMIAEFIAPGFGVLGIGGSLSFIVGAMFLFNTDYLAIHLPFVIIISLINILLYIVFGVTLYKLRKRKLISGQAAIIGKNGIVIEEVLSSTTGLAKIDGEIWKIVSDQNLTKNDKIVVKGINGLILFVHKYNNKKAET